MSKGVRYFLTQSESEGRAVGCVALEQASAEVCYLERLAVLPEHRKLGLGSSLVEFVSREAAKLGAARLEIGLIARQEELVTWYGKRGFVLTGTKNFDHLPFGVAFMTRELDRPGLETEIRSSRIE